MSISEKDVKICGHGSGTPSIKSLYTYTSQRYAKTAPNGKRKGVVCVRRLKAMTDEGRKKFTETYDIIIGRNVYSQARRGYVFTKYSNGKYYSDCSSSGMATMKKIGYNIGSYLLNTAGIYSSDKFETVPVVIKNGHITNPEVLKVADCILYMGNDPKRPKQIGHVEYVYKMPVSGKSHYSGKYPSLANGRTDFNGKGYYRRGDGIDTLKNFPTQIKRIQKLVNWITGDSISVDGKYGSQTEKAVKKAQLLLKVNVSGIFDYTTREAAKDFMK